MADNFCHGCFLLVLNPAADCMHPVWIIYCMDHILYGSCTVRIMYCMYPNTIDAIRNISLDKQRSPFYNRLMSETKIFNRSKDSGTINIQPQ